MRSKEEEDEKNDANLCGCKKEEDEKKNVPQKNWIEKKVNPFNGLILIHFS